MTDYEKYVKNNRDLLKGKEKLSQSCDWDYQSKKYGIPCILMSLPYLKINYSWCDEYINILINNKITNLYFSEVKGIEQNLELFSNLYFLKELTLRGLSYGEKDYNFDGLKYLTNLEMLDCRGSQSSNPIDFNYLKKLKICSLEHALHKNNKTLFECLNLEELYVYGYLDKDFSFNRLTNLKKLTLQTTTLITIEGIENLTKLVDLEIIKSKKIKDFKYLSKVKSIKRLHLKYFKSDNLIETISKLKNLEFLSLEYVGSIQSISDLVNCQNLKEIFIAYGTTNILDGDLSVFFKLPKLKKVLIETKKHYSHSNEELHEHTGQNKA